MGRYGYSFIEVILVVSLLAIVVTFSSLFYTRLLLRNSVIHITDQLVGSLRKAQTYSMMGRQNGSWGVRYAANTITLFLVGNSAFDERYSVNPNISMSGLTQITFAKGSGLPTPSSGATITVSVNTISKTVTVNSQGVVSK